MRGNRWPMIRLLAGLALVFVAGCSGVDEDLVPCPAARILGEPSELTRFREGPGQDPTDILFEAKFQQVDGECSYDVDGGEIKIELNVVIDVLRGRANADGTASFSYFLAVTERDKETGPEPVVQARREFAVDLSFAARRRNIRYTDVLGITIPRPDARSVSRYVLYLGFELTPDELAYNKRKLGL